MIEVLDSGYVLSVESWGSDERIVEAARMSTAKGFLGWGTPKEPGDEKLLRYLYAHNHATPFEMAGLVVEVKAPIFVFREWHRHRTQSYNEMSARYVPLPDENYLPSVDRLMVSAGKQGGTSTCTVDTAETFRRSLQGQYAAAQHIYELALSQGIPKELARVHLPVARYSKMRASANLRNWLAFLTLREAPAAQWEIRQYAHAVASIVEEKFPRTFALYRG